MNIEKMKFAMGPARTVKNLLSKGASWNCLELELKDLPTDCVFIEARLSSPENFTKPPKGITANCHSVPFLSLKDKIFGPKPMLNTSTSILFRRAIMKWPYSWTNTTIPNANTIDKNWKIKMPCS